MNRTGSGQNSRGRIGGEFKSFELLLIATIFVSISSYSNSNQLCATAAAASDINTTTSENNSTELLISGDEFVDQTEAPMLLFDQLSPIEANATQANKNSSQFEATSEFEAKKSGSFNESAAAIESSENNEPEDDEEESSAPSQDGAEPFSPPQNVSQYMDYIERLFHDLRHQITDLFEPHIPQLIRTSQMVQLTSSCSYDMLKLALALREFEPWALKMIDSSGKLPEGIFEGSFTSLGSYDECLNTNFISSRDKEQRERDREKNEAEPAASTQGKYCLVNVSPYMPPKPPADRVERVFQDEANRRNYKKDDQFSRLSPMFYYMKFRIGVCVPSTCIDSDLKSISETLSSSLRLNITIAHCKVKQNLPLTGHQLVGGFIFGSIVCLVLAATAIDYFKKKFETIDSKEEKIIFNLHQERNKNNLNFQNSIVINDLRINSEMARAAANKLDKNWIWQSFSFLTNFKLYFKSKETIKWNRRSRPEPQQKTNGIINCLDGIRVISLCWIIIANSYITLDPKATKRLTITRQAPKDFLFQMIAQASLAIETFFFLSGLLMSLSFFRKLEQQYDDAERSSRNGGQFNLIKWFHFYLHRYIRTTPATMLVIAFTMFAFSYGDGPLWIETTHKAHLSCNENWWRHLLHIANFIDTRQMCFIHYWYIAADMQLFLFAPILMLIIYRHRRLGYFIISLIGLASIANVFYMTYARNLPPTLLFYNSDPESRREFGNTIMTKPLTHALPYMVGMIMGKWLATSTSGQTSKTLNSSTHRVKTFPLANYLNSTPTIFGLMAAVVALGEVFLPYKWNNSHLPTKFLASLYASLFRLAWSLALAYLVVSCRHQKSKKCYSKERKRLKICCARGAADGKFNLIRNVEENLHLEASNSDDRWCFCGSSGNVLNRLLSLKIFTHLSKLSFVAYLIHLPLMSVFVAQTRGLFAFSHTLVIHLALSYLLMTFILSFILVHIIEFPFLTLERYIFERIVYSKDGDDLKEKMKNNKRKRDDLNRESNSENNFESEGVGKESGKSELHFQANHQTPGNFSENFRISERL